MQGALGRAGGPRCVNNQGRIVRFGFNRSEISGSFFDQLVEIQNLICFFTAGNNHHFQVWQVLSNFQDLWQIGAIGDDAFGFAVGQTILEGIGAEKGEQRNGDGAKLVSGNMTDGRFRTLGQQDPETVTLPDAVGLKAVGQPVGQPLQIGKGVFFDPAAFIFINQGQALGLFGPFVADIHADVVVLRDLPAEGIVDLGIGIAGFEHGKISYI